MRADRLLSIVLLLQSRGRLTARELAARLEVSPRTIQRDMEALSAGGVPVVAERGAGGGWSLLGEYRTSLTGLNDDELHTLFVTRPTRVLADLKLGQAAERALLKLLAALPSVRRDGAEHARQRVHIDVAGWHRPEESAPLLATLQEAVWRGLQLRITYARGGGCDAVERVVDPLGLVAKGSVWYLVASVGGEVRSYRASGVRSAEPTGTTAVRPEGFDLAEFWEKSAEQFRAHLPHYRVTARVREDVVPRLPYGGRFARVERRGERDAEGWVEVALRFDSEEMACEYALGFGTLLEVLEPPALREKVLEAARGVVALYERKGAGRRKTSSAR